MRSLSRIIAVTTLLLVGLGSAAVAQDEEPRRRRAQPRESAPRSEPPAAAAPAPPPRQDHAVTRSRGTDHHGRARVPREDAGSPEQGRDTARREPRERTERVAPATTTRSEPSSAEPTAPPRAVTRSRGTDYYGRVRAPREADGNPDQGRDAARRDPRSDAAAPSHGAPELAAAPSSSASSAEQDERRRRAVPRGSRPRGDNPAVGRAEPRTGGYPREGRRRDDGGSWDRDSWRGSRVYSSRSRVYNNYYHYYPRRWYPYGYGAFGLGYFYYDPYTWYSYDPYWSRSHHYYRYRTYDDYYYDTGELRLQVHPRHAEVYVDGYFAGHVDDFDGMFQGLRLEDGPHTIEITAPGFEPLVFDVRILPGRKTTYRGDLRRVP